MSFILKALEKSKYEIPYGPNNSNTPLSKERKIIAYDI
jgi:hypothetical protein